MALLTDYTTYAEIRATLGVNVDEISDATLALEMYATNVERELDGIDSDLATDYATVKAIVEASRTAAQQKFYLAVRLFVPYAVGVHLASSLPLFSPKQVTDGKAAMTRYADSPYKVAIEECKKNYDTFKVYLEDKYAVYGGGAETATALRPFMGVVSPDTDPVTG